MAEAPLRQILVLPLVAAGLLVAAIGTVVAHLDHDASLRSAIRARAISLADSIADAAERESGPELQRHALRLGAARDVAGLAVVGGTPPKVIAGTRSAWIGREPASVPGLGAIEALAGELRGGERFYLDPDRHRFVLARGLPRAQAGEAAVAIVQLEAESPRRELWRHTARSALLAGGLVAVLGLALFRSVRRHAVEPICEIARALARQTRGEDALQVREDFEALEHGALARSLNLAMDARNRARLQLEQSEADLRLLAQINRIADGSDDRDGALRACCERICSDLRWAGGHVFLADREDRDRLVDAGAWYLTDAQRFARFVEATLRLSPRADVDLPGRALAKGEPVWVADCRETEWFERSRDDEGEVRAAAAFPIWVDGNAAGVLEVFDPGPREFDFRMVALMQNLGFAVGQVLHRREARERLLHRDRELEEAVGAANRSRRELLTEVGHEIRTPMAAILGYAELLETPQKEEERREAIATIRRNGERVLRLIDDILDERRR